MKVDIDVSSANNCIPHLLTMVLEELRCMINKWYIFNYFLMQYQLFFSTLYVWSWSNYSSACKHVIDASPENNPIHHLLNMLIKNYKGWLINEIFIISFWCNTNSFFFLERNNKLISTLLIGFEGNLQH